MEFKTRKTKINSTELFLPSQTSIEINQSSEDRLKLNDSNKINFNQNQKIRCKFIKPKDVDLNTECDKLLIHFVSDLFIDTI